MSINPRLRAYVLERDNYTCRYCGAEPTGRALQVDHVIPVSKGGRDHEDNLVCACGPCNIKKKARFLEFYEMLGVAPEMRYDERYQELGYVCSKCGGVVEHGGDNLCSCTSKRDRTPRCERCEEELDIGDDELCSSCYHNLYVYCWDCGENEQLEGSDYCAECQR